MCGCPHTPTGRICSLGAAQYRLIDPLQVGNGVIVMCNTELMDKFVTGTAKDPYLQKARRAGLRVVDELFLDKLTAVAKNGDQEEVKVVPQSMVDRLLEEHTISQWPIKVSLRGGRGDGRKGICCAQVRSSWCTSAVMLEVCAVRSNFVHAHVNGSLRQERVCFYFELFSISLSVFW